MAGDWIKMRNNLWDDPRVSRMCDLTDSSEAAIIGALYWLWAMADEHTEDGHLPGLTLSGIDRKTGVKGFGAALVEIGWLADTDGGVTIQSFEEHNGASAKRRATDAQRKANSRNVSASDADNMRTEAGQNAPDLGAREEKNKEEKKEETKTPKAPRKRAAVVEGDPRAIELPDWLPVQAWNDWVDHRIAVKAPMTERAANLAVKRLGELRDMGSDPVAVIEQSVRSGKWTDLYELKTPGNPRASPGMNGAHFNKQEALEASNRAVAERWARSFSDETH